MNLRPSKITATIAQVVMVLWIAAVAIGARAEYRDWIGEEQTANSRWIPKFKYMLLDTDAERDVFDSQFGGHQEVTRYYISPRVAVGWDNYIYHPYLLTYSALFEPGYTWRRTSVNGAPNDNNEFTVNGKVSAQFLSPKPYATTFTFDRGHDEVQYGFFNMASVDSEAWGIVTGYRQGGIPVQLSFNQTHEDAEELFQRTLTTQRDLDLSAQNERHNHNTTFFTYQYTEFDRTVEAGNAIGTIRNISNDSAINRVDVEDTEHFERSILKSSMRVANRESDQSSVNDFNGGVNYDLDLTERLHNYEQGSYSLYTGDGFDSTYGYASAGLRHQLYESLVSAVDVHGSWANNGSSTESTESTSAGTTITEDYSKRLGSWGRLSLSDSASFNLNNQSTSGGILLIANESHVVPTNSIVRLSHVQALTLVRIVDSNSVPLEAADYTIIHSEPLQIQISPFGPSHIQPGAVIQVTYTIIGTGSSTSFSDAVQLRLSFWNEMASIYARYSFTDNHASSSDVIVDNEDVFEAGVNYTWKRLVLNADYSDQHSTFFTLKSFNLSESYSMDTSDNSTLEINLNQQWSDDISVSGPAQAQLKQHSTFYNFMLSYDWRPLPRLSWKNEIGYQYQTGLNINENLFAARSYLNWMVGRIQMNMGYEHDNVDYLHESKLRDYVFFKLRRTF
ncbi:MAG: hypothetical protein ACXWIU_13855 [Limisphaerales bacterium]